MIPVKIAIRKIPATLGNFLRSQGNWNTLITELQNLITSNGQALSTTDFTQYQHGAAGSAAARFVTHGGEIVTHNGVVITHQAPV